MTDEPLPDPPPSESSENAGADLISEQELDQILMGALPMAHNLEFLQILPLRAYDNFASDVRSRWKGES